MGKYNGPRKFLVRSQPWSQPFYSQTVCWPWDSLASVYSQVQWLKFFHLT